LELKLIPVDRDDAQSVFNQTFSMSHKVFQKYQMAIHNDSPDECTEKSFRRFLCSPPFTEEVEQGGYHHQYYIDGKLVAVGVLDLLPRCISSVYFYYDPDYAGLSFGTLSALFEIQLTQQLNTRHPNIEWYYMGYYIHSCPKMKYKSKFYPSYLLCPKKYTWWPVEDCEKQLDQRRYCVFDDRTGDETLPTEEQLGSLKVLLDRRLCLYSVYKMVNEDDDYSDILFDFVKLTGLENAQNICIYH
jgi:arginine-tRNA-protein transferase